MVKRIFFIIVLFIGFKQIGYAQPPSLIDRDSLAPTVATASITSFTATTATMGGNVTADGGLTVIERGVVYSTSNVLPTLANNKLSIGNGLGVFSATVNGLTGGTLYYVRAYAINIIGISYGASNTFTTTSTAPTVSTSEISSITLTGAAVGGNVNSDGGANVTERGIVYSSTNTSPTVGDTKMNSGSGTGLFTQNLTGLNANTNYYVRAYAINNIGTSYGNIISFTTGGPTLTTAVAKTITQTTVTLGGTITATGSSAVTERGVVYIAGNADPTINNNKTVIGSDIGSFEQIITGLLPGTLYSFKAYAINAAGICFGDTKTFTTATSINSISIIGNTLTSEVVGNFKVVFAQPIAGLTASNFSVTATGLTNNSIIAVTGKDTTWNVIVATGRGQGTLVLNLANTNGISPLIGNTLPFASAALTVNKELPVINTQPTASTICVGANTSFAVAATSFVPITYQWQINNGSGFVNINNGAPYSNATTPTLTITGANLGLNGSQYRCVTTNNAGSSNSNAVLLTISASPSKPVINWNSSQLSTATGLSSYQWLLGGNAVNGANSNIHIPTAIGSYTVSVTNAGGCSATSDPYSLVVTAVIPLSVAGSSVKLYPNPTQSEAWVEFEQPPLTTIQIKIINSSGTVLQQLISKQKRNRLNVNGLAKGLYYVEINNGKQKGSLQLLIQ